MSLAMPFYVAYHVVYTAICSLAGYLTDRLPKPRVLALGYALANVPAAALLLPGTSFATFAVVFWLSGVYMGFWETIEGASTATYLSVHVRGPGFGLLATINGIGDVVSSVVVLLTNRLSGRAS